MSTQTRKTVYTVKLSVLVSTQFKRVAASLVSDYLELVISYLLNLGKCLRDTLWTNCLLGRFKCPSTVSARMGCVTVLFTADDHVEDVP